MYRKKNGWNTYGDRNPEEEYTCPDTEEPGDSFRKKEEKKAAVRAMKLLLVRQRTESELRNRLLEEGFSGEATEEALDYVRSFGYINDEKYTENYIVSMSSRKSRRVIETELLEKGVPCSLIEAAFEENPVDEEEVVYRLLTRKLGNSGAYSETKYDSEGEEKRCSEDAYTHKIQDKELRRVYNFLARKGFSSGSIWRAIRKYEAEGQV